MKTETETLEGVPALTRKVTPTPMPEAASKNNQAKTIPAAEKKEPPTTSQDLSKRSKRRNRRRGFKPKRRGRPSRMFAGGSR